MNKKVNNNLDHGVYLDKIEKVDISFEFLEESPGEGIEEKVDKDKTVVESLRLNSQFWGKLGAGKFVKSVIATGLRLNFARGCPDPYQEPNNKSFQKNLEFGTKEIMKLVESKAVVEVDREGIICVNPLSVASNQEGKLRLCIDLSRCVNNHCQTKKF